MKRTATILIGLLLIMISLFSCKKEEDTYKTPYEPGVYVDKEGFELHKQLWEENVIKNYSYTYSYSAGPEKGFVLYSYKIDVTVENGEVSQYVLKEYKEQTEEEVSQDLWKSYQENLSKYKFKDKNVLSIDNLYSQFEKSIEFFFEALKENPKYFYNETEVEFSDKAPYISSYNEYILIMEEYLDGNSGFEEIKIENFKEN